jgi:hypothetical protein
MTRLETNNQSIVLSSFVTSEVESIESGRHKQSFKPKFDLLQPLRNWLEEIEIQNRKLAKIIAKTIPAQCPFERDIVLFGHKVAHIPPMCKLNPLYDEVVGLRFRALCYLADVCGEDIQSYC